jgi:hypothetical protein
MQTASIRVASSTLFLLISSHWIAEWSRWKITLAEKKEGKSTLVFTKQRITEVSSASLFAEFYDCIRGKSAPNKVVTISDAEKI